MGIMREKVEKNKHDEEKHLVETKPCLATQATFKRSVTTKPNPNQTDRFRTAVRCVYCTPNVQAVPSTM